MAFKPIETQEDLDIIIGERLKREREANEKKYAGFDEAKEKAAKYDKLIAQDFEGQLQKLNEELSKEREKNAGHDQAVADLTARANKAEVSLLKAKIAHEAGLPYELANRLNGNNEEELLADAKTLTGFLKPNNAPPLRTTEPGQMSGSNHKSALAALAASMVEPKI